MLQEGPISCLDCIFPKYVDALINEKYPYSNKLLGKDLEEQQQPPITSSGL